MDKKSLRRKKAILIILSLMLLTPKLACTKEYHPEIEILENNDAYAEYRNGRVFIGSRYYLWSIRDQIEENDIVVLDRRYATDPNMTIYNSYRIRSAEERNDILEILQLYEREYPSEWKRSIESMRGEWAIHNLFYSIDFKLNSTKDVDLNNGDEEIYNKTLIKLFFN